MNQKNRERIESAKNYVKDRAPAVLTATATVVTALTVVAIRKDLRQEGKLRDRNMKHDSDIITQCIDEGRNYTYLPGLGVHVHPATDKLLAEKS